MKATGTQYCGFNYEITDIPMFFQYYRIVDRKERGGAFLFPLFIAQFGGLLPWYLLVLFRVPKSPGENVCQIVQTNILPKLFPVKRGDFRFKLWVPGKNREDKVSKVR